MKRLAILLLFYAFSSSACIQFSNEFDQDATVISEIAEMNPLVKIFQVQIPATVDGSIASYAYIYVKKDNLPLFTVSPKIEETFDTSNLPLEDKKEIYISVRDSIKQDVVIHIHYESKSEAVTCGPVRRYRLDQLSEEEL